VPHQELYSKSGRAHLERREIVGHTSAHHRRRLPKPDRRRLASNEQATLLIDWLLTNRKSLWCTAAPFASVMMSCTKPSAELMLHCMVSSTWVKVAPWAAVP
jgi:hypothetical protein